ncbi:MAG: gfo/Idh/MocA family oxidoreductase [Sulfobacillus acidophilus]|uniref:Gfo/Idh/MocA family oxidoreductase n=1 Tax=Sulfobacillus acidophilus TaxID=53633 RepID=A0A2T2WLG0_9FIRM|nr:MAG: gfo/Idh/MocA family oxidoreductase [Sulfobacillus acidophilus]
MRVALIGCGKVGHRHLQALVHDPLVDLLATVDTDPAKAAAAAVAFDADSFADVDALLAQHRHLDGVILATPSGTHRRLTEQLLNAGLNVLVERPMALDADDARAMVATAKQASRVLAVTHASRLLPSVARALDVFERGQMGEVIEGAVSVCWSRPQSYYQSAPWRGTRRMDGGVLFNQAIAALDVLLQFCGRIDEVFAYAGTVTHEIESEDTAVGVMRADTGGLFTITATTSVHDNDLEERLTLMAKTGTVVFGPTLRQIEHWHVPDEDEDEVRQALNDPTVPPSWKGHLEALEDFRQAVQSGVACRLSADSTVHTIEVVQALMQSAQTGCPVKIGELTS